MTMAVEHLWRVPFEAELNCFEVGRRLLRLDLRCFPLLGMRVGSYVIKGPHHLTARTQ